METLSATVPRKIPTNPKGKKNSPRKFPENSLKKCSERNSKEILYI